MSAIIRRTPTVESAPRVPPPLRWIVDRVSRGSGGAYVSTRDLARRARGGPRSRLGITSGAEASIDLGPRPLRGRAARWFSLRAAPFARGAVAGCLLAARRPSKTTGGADVSTNHVPEGVFLNNARFTRTSGRVYASQAARATNPAVAARVGSPESAPSRWSGHPFDLVGRRDGRTPRPEPPFGTLARVPFAVGLHGRRRGRRLRGSGLVSGRKESRDRPDRDRERSGSNTPSERCFSKGQSARPVFRRGETGSHSRCSPARSL